MKCSIGKCQAEGKYALYELFSNGTKIWRTDLCGWHDKDIAERNYNIKKNNPGLKYLEVYSERAG